MKKKTHHAAMAALFLMLPGHAFADCEDIAQNEEWRRNLIDVAAFHDHGDYKESLEIGLKMLVMCDRSPALNYYIASDYQALGENAKAFAYILKASDGTAHMATSKENEESIKRKREELETIVMGETSAKINLYKYKNEYKTAMWSGLGVGISGAALTILGVLLVTSDDDGSGSSSNTNSSNDLAGYCLLGSGLAMLVGGAVLGGIYGYKYMHFEEENTQFSFHVMPTSVGLSVTF